MNSLNWNFVHKILISKDNPTSQYVLEKNHNKVIKQDGAELCQGLSKFASQLGRQIKMFKASDLLR